MTKVILSVIPFCFPPIADPSSLRTFIAVPVNELILRVHLDFNQSSAFLFHAPDLGVFLCGRVLLGGGIDNECMKRSTFSA